MIYKPKSLIFYFVQGLPIYIYIYVHYRYFQPLWMYNTELSMRFQCALHLCWACGMRDGDTKVLATLVTVEEAPRDILDRVAAVAMKTLPQLVGVTWSKERAP